MRGGGAIGKHVHLLLFDSVFHFAASAVKLLVKATAVGKDSLATGPRFVATEVCDDVARGAFALRQFDFTDDAPLAAPAILRALAQLGEAVRGALQLGRCMRSCCAGAEHGFFIEKRGTLPEGGFQHSFESAVACEAKDIMHAHLRLDPGHQRLAAKARVSAHDDGGVFDQAFADDRYDLLQGFERAVAAIAVGGAKLRPERDVVTKAVERQVAVRVVVTVEKALLLMAVQGIVRGLEIKDDDLALTRDGGHATTQQQHLDVVRMGGDLFGSRVGAVGTEFETVERAFARQRLALVLLEMALFAEHIGTPQHGGQERIGAQRVMVIEVLVAERQGEDALAQHDGEIVLNEALIAPVGKAVGELRAEALGAIRLAQQQAATAAGEVAARKISLHTAASKALKVASLLITLCCRLSLVPGGW